MFGYSVVTAMNRIATGESDEVWRPRKVRDGRCGLILCHGAGTNGEYIDTVAQPSAVKLAATLASIGIPCVSGDLGGSLTFANDTSMTRIGQARTLLASQFPTIRTDKVCLLGISMGGALVARYSQLHPTEVAAVVGIIPAFDLRYEYENVSAVAAEIGGAWGVTPPTPLPSAADLKATASLAAGIPLLAGYSTVDTTVIAQPVLDYVAAVGGTAIVTDSTFGHSDAAVGGMPIPTVAKFLVANGA